MKQIELISPFQSEVDNLALGIVFKRGEPQTVSDEAAEVLLRQPEVYKDVTPSDPAPAAAAEPAKPVLSVVPPLEPPTPPEIHASEHVT